MLKSSKRFSFDAHMDIAEIDLHRLSHDRILKNTFISQGPAHEYRRVRFSAKQALPEYREIGKLPFVPGDRQSARTYAAARCSTYR